MSNKAGRPREFDDKRALGLALRLFWRKGFAGTSLSDLTEELGINKPSLYAAFGNKEELFKRALEYYVELVSDRMQAILSMRTAREVAEAFLRAEFEESGDIGPGCFLLSSSLIESRGAPCAQEAACKQRTRQSQMLTERFEMAQADGDLPKDADPKVLAAYLMAVRSGITSLEVGSRLEREDRKAVIDLVMKNWPS